MMGRLFGYEERDNGKVAQGNYHFPTEQNRASTQNRSATIPPYHTQTDASLPLIQTAHFNSPSSQFHRSPSVTGPRAQTSFQEPLRPASVREPKVVRSCATSPTFKLPPVSTSKSASVQAGVNMPPHSISENSTVPEYNGPEGNESKGGFAPNLDIKMAYENMMTAYFMPQPQRSENACLSKSQNEQLQIIHPNTNQYNFNSDPKTYSLQTSQQNFQYTPQYSEAFHLPYGTLPQELFQTLPADQILPNQPSSQSQRDRQVPHLIRQSNQQHNVMNVTASEGAVINTSGLHEQGNLATVSAHTSQLLNNSFPSTSIPRSSSKTFQPSNNATLQNQSDISAMASVLNDLSMFISPQEPTEIESLFTASNIRTIPSSELVTTTSSTLSTATHSFSSVSNVPYQTKVDPNWGRMSVLPPVIPSGTSSGGGYNDGDNTSLMSYASASSNAQNSSQMGLYYNTFSPFSVNFTENIPSAFTSSPRYSARSSYSSRSRNKRSLSISPLSAEGIDINAIIRMSPTSLNAYLNGSRSSSSCVSPGSYGDKTGCYGHLSARNSSSSPQSGSGSSGNRRSASFTPQTGTPGNNNVTSENSNLSIACSNNERMKNDFLNMDDNLFVMQAMQDLESGVGLPNLHSSFNTNVIHNAQLAPEYENLQVLPQDLAAFRTEDYIPFIPSVLPPVHTHLASHFQPLPSQAVPTVVAHTKPPPTYDQHMATRKATLQKNNSSDSSQPSNSNSSSFESSEGDKTVAGSSGTDTESNRMYACRWLDCAAVFQDQDEFVTHIEKTHIDQKKGDDFICFWKLCPRRLHPFNARYKLLVHMRIHSGDKPNKCTHTGCTKAFSRLENLKIHLRSHTGERPYSCTFPGCTKTFSNSSDRTKHQKTHHDTKPYVCQFAECGKRYTDPSSLRKHVKKSHPDKKEPDRKKIRSAVDELDPKDLSECLVIHSIKPVTMYDASPPEPTDSGLGRSPRSSQPGSSSDHYPGLIYSGEVQGTSSQTSPSSQHSSPPGHNDREKLPTNNNSLRVPILPPIAPSPVQQQQCFPSLKSPVSNSTSPFARVPSSASGISRNSSSLLQRPKLVYEGLTSMAGVYSDSSTSPNSRSSYASPLRNHSRDCC